MSEKLNIALLWLTGTALFADLVWLLLMMCTFNM
jgi:hypothetical protein